MTSSTDSTVVAPVPAIPASAISPGRWWLRWIDGKNEEHVRRVVVSDREGVSLWLRFADDQWQPRPDATWTLVGYLPADAGFLVPDEAASDE